MDNSAQHRSILEALRVLVHLGLRQTGCMPLDSRSFSHVTSLGIRGHHLCLELDNTYSLVASDIMCLALSDPFPVWICVSFSLVRPYFFFHNLFTCSLKLLNLFWASRIDLPASLSLVSLPLGFQCLLQIIPWVYVLVISGYHIPNPKELFICSSLSHTTDSLF